MAIGNLFKSKPWKPDKMPRDKKQGRGFGRATMAGATAVGAAALFGDGDILDMAFGALALGITKDIFSGVSSLFASKDKDTNSNFEKINDGEKLQNRNLNEEYLVKKRDNFTLSIFLINIKYDLKNSIT